MAERPPIVRGPDQGRTYPVGPMTAVFKADGTETDDRYSVSVWTIEPHGNGPGAHHHDDHDDIFFVLEGEITFTLDDKEHVAGPGSYIQASAGVTHDYRNDTDRPARFLNLYIPGGFEAGMGPIVAWFQNNANSRPEPVDP